MPRIIRIIQNNGALQYTEQAAIREVESALACLDSLPASRYRDELAALGALFCYTAFLLREATFQ
jgi:geranylgeranyl pyrophosphate synthase